MTEYAAESHAEVVVDLNEKKPIRVLLVDDEPGLLKIAKQCLEMQGPFQVDTASSAEEALEKVREDSYDAVVSDYVMPEKDGLQFLKELRATGNGIPFIIFTGKGREEVAIQALNLGANQYINKTGDPETVYCELAHGIRQAVQRNKAEERIRRSEEKYRNLFELAPDVLITLDMKGVITSCNAAALATSSYSQDEIVGKHFSKLGFLRIRDMPKYLTLSASIARGNVPKPVQVTWHSKDGTPFVCEFHIGLIKEDGKTVGFQVDGRDITERKKAEEALKQSEEKYRNLFENAKDVIVLFDLKANVTSVNKAAEEYGFSKSGILGKNMLKFVSKRYWPKLLKDVAQIALGKAAEGRIEIHTPKGDKIAEYRSTPIFSNNRVVGIQTILEDATERKKAEEALRESEEKYKDLFENAMDVILTLDLKGSVTAVNNSVLRFGYRKEDLVGKSVFDFVSKQYWPTIMRDFSQVIQGEHAKNETELVVPTGKIFVEYHARAIAKESNVTGVQINLRDITERKKAEQALLESQKKFERLFMDNPEPAVYLDKDFHILDVNPRFTTLFDHSPDEVRGKHINDVAVPREKMEEAEMLDRKATNGIVYHDTVRKRKDGSLIPVSISAAPLIVNNQLLGHVAVYKDISLLKKTERELAIMNEKLRVIGGLTRHDARNKLSAVTGNAYLAKKELATGSKALEYLNEIEEAVQQTARIFDFAKAYEMLGAEELGYIDVEKTVNEAFSLFSGLKNVKVVNDCHGLMVLADSLLRQLFYSLIDNSLKYGQKITKVRVRYERTGNDKLRLTYEDDGVGIDDTEKPKLFTEGYSTGGSTGYGLYLVKKMMEAYGWTIQETGEFGKGARFVITIPETNPSGKENYRIA